MTSRRSRGVPLAEEGPPGPARRTVRAIGVLGLVVVVGVAAWFALSSLLETVTPSRCRATALGSSVTFDPEQTSNAATITAITLTRGLPARAATIALATAIQESKLRNIRYGDRDSLGLFQQRPSQGWGTEEQVLDPEYATNAFLDALVKIDGYEDLPITEVAQQVQRSAYPAAYADHEQEGRVLASALSGHSPGGLGCRLPDPDQPADAGALQRMLQAEYGLTGTVSGDVLRVSAPSQRLAWSVGAWTTAKAVDTGVVGVVVGDREWTRTMQRSGWQWQQATEPDGSTEVSIRLR